MKWACSRNVLMFGTVHGIVTVSRICLSVCLQRRGRYVMLRITLFRIYYKSTKIDYLSRELRHEKDHWYNTYVICVAGAV